MQRNTHLHPETTADSAPPLTEEAPKGARASNRLVWRGQSGHYEVWFLNIYDGRAGAGTGYWLRYTLESPCPGHGTPYVEVWFCRGDAATPERNFGIHRRFPLGSFASAPRA
jgi:hypothetical protein